MPERPTGAVTWLGHATVLIELDGARVLTDPVLRDRVAHLRRAAPAPPVPEALDAVLISHAHRDHLDTATLRTIPPEAPVLAPRGSVPALRGAGRRHVRAVTAGDRVEVAPGVSAQVVPAVHDGRRHPLAPASDGVGFVVEGSRRIYFAGDTDYFDELRDLRPLDAALIPIWGWGPSLGPGHLDPEGAARAVAALQPALAIPIHWGTYLPISMGAWRAGLLTEPARAFRAHTRRLAPGVRVEVAEPGTRIVL